MYAFIAVQCSASSPSLRLAPSRSLSSLAQERGALFFPDRHPARLDVETGSIRAAYRQRVDKSRSSNERPGRKADDDGDSVYVKRFSGDASEQISGGDGDSSRLQNRGARSSSRDGYGRGETRVEGTFADRQARFGERKGDGGSSLPRPNSAGWRLGGRRENGGERQRDGDVEGRRQEENGKFEMKKKMKKKGKESSIAPQVKHERVMSKDPEVGILGGGMAGLVCALTLEKLGIRSTVFDTGKHGLGGRMGTRHVEVREGAPPLLFDHAAQFFTVTDARFQKLVDEWMSEGAVKEWKGSIGVLQAGGQYTHLPPAARYVATHGMRLLADHLVSQSKLIRVRRPVWISNMYPHNSRWSLVENGRREGEFDVVVIAHNGKCANRLLGPAGVPFIYKQMKRMELSSIWALLAAFDEPLPVPQGFEGDRLSGAFVEGVNAVTWIGDNTAKLDLQGSPHCYTCFSSAAYGKKNKVPQESIPVVRAQRVTREMLQGVELALGLEEGSLPKPFFSKVQLWGAGLPTNTPGLPCIFDAFGRVGICGDWLLGSSLEAAALSGMAMAEQIAAYRDRGDFIPEDFCVGLEEEFRPIDAHDIGQFPGSVSRAEESSTLELVAA